MEAPTPPTCRKRETQDYLASPPRNAERSAAAPQETRNAARARPGNAERETQVAGYLYLWGENSRPDSLGAARGRCSGPLKFFLTH